MKITEITPEELSVEGFKPFGIAIMEPGDPADREGDNWKCWVGVEDLSPGNSSLGIVTVSWNGAPVDEMEAHGHRELLMPLKDPIIQAVAIPADMEDINAQPDVKDIKAFIVRPGQSIMMEVGTWHCAAVPVDGETIYYFVTNSGTYGPGHTENRWVKFKDNEAFKLRKV